MPDLVIIVDSSDSMLSTLNKEYFDYDLNYYHVDIKSAAVQRNLGMERIPETCKYLLFLDDDVLPPNDYISRLIVGLEATNGIGLAPMVTTKEKSEIRTKPSGIVGLFKRIFKLDSNIDGKLLKSGINIPVRTLKDGYKNTEWLIGCAMWKYKTIKRERFYTGFYGQSLGEDVIFSSNASILGPLYVDSSLILEHIESQIERPTNLEFWRMWTKNRFLMVELIKLKKVAYLSVVFANLGQFLILFSKSLYSKEVKISACLGIPLGTAEFINFLWMKNAN